MFHGLTMNPVEKAFWIQALRSGKYEQGQGVLKREIIDQRKCTYCCLGVYAKEHNLRAVPCEKTLTKRTYSFIFPDGKDTHVGNEAELGLYWFSQFFTFEGYGKAYYGMVDALGDLQVKLVNMNDGHKSDPSLSFSEIADWIDDNL